MAYSAATERMSAEEFVDWEAKQPEKHEFIYGEIFAKPESELVVVALATTELAKN